MAWLAMASSLALGWAETSANRFNRRISGAATAKGHVGNTRNISMPWALAGSVES